MYNNYLFKVKHKDNDTIYKVYGVRLVSQNYAVFLCYDKKLGWFSWTTEDVVPLEELTKTKKGGKK